MAKRLVLARLGMSFLCDSHYAAAVAQGRLAAVSLGPEPLIRRLALVYRKDKSLSKAALGFIQVMLEHSDAAAAGSRVPQAVSSR